MKIQQIFYYLSYCNSRGFRKQTLGFYGHEKAVEKKPLSWPIVADSGGDGGGEQREREKREEKREEGFGYGFGLAKFLMF